MLSWPDPNHPDGRVFETKCGILVRSKSEMLLANEFTARGMYFEYEEPDPNVPNALPDFSFPDYGRVVLEHLGLMDDADYMDRWKKKAKAYEKQGVLALRTNEEEIKYLASTVDRLQEQLRSWVETQYGPERIQLIDLIEKIRRRSEFVIGGSIGDFSNGMFEVIGSNEAIIAVVAPQFSKRADGDSTSDEGSFLKDIPGYGRLVWEESRLDEIPVMIGRMAGAGT